MAIDASIYQNIKTPQVEMPNYADSMGKALSLSNLSMQNKQAQMQMQQQQLQLQQQQAMRDAYASNMAPNGQLDQQGYMSALGKINPQMAMDSQEKFNKMNKDAAEAQSAKIEAAAKATDALLPAMNYLSGLSEDDRAKAYPLIMAQVAQSGALPPQSIQNMPKDADGNFTYSPDFFKQSYGVLKNTAANLNSMKAQAEITKTYSDIGQAPAKLNSELYGSRSPNAELTSQYDKQAAPVRSSQMAMNQMIDNYKNPSPQGDASLVLNAFKIKFPNAPDVNSLEELTHSQSASDTFKNAAAKALAGGLDQGTRDNLMRDGVSTFRANVQSLNGIKQRYNSRAQAQNVNDPTMTAEPAIDKTYSDALDLQKKIGPYVPPSDRGGFMGTLNKLASSVVGVGGNQQAKASEDAKTYAPPGSKISSDLVAQYATRHGMKMSEAQDYLKGRGYVIGR